MTDRTNAYPAGHTNGDFSSSGCRRAMMPFLHCERMLGMPAGSEHSEHSDRPTAEVTAPSEVGKALLRVAFGCVGSHHRGLT